jgi:predicted nucleic acid-binding protein
MKLWLKVQDIQEQKRYIGLIGILVEAKHKGLIHKIKPYLDALCDMAGFRGAQELYYRVLQDEGEI